MNRRTFLATCLGAAFLPLAWPKAAAATPASLTLMVDKHGNMFLLDEHGEWLGPLNCEGKAFNINAAGNQFYQARTSESGWLEITGGARLNTA